MEWATLSSRRPAPMAQGRLSSLGKHGPSSCVLWRLCWPSITNAIPQGVLQYATTLTGTSKKEISDKKLYTFKKFHCT